MSDGARIPQRMRPAGEGLLLALLLALLAACAGTGPAPRAVPAPAPSSTSTSVGASAPGTVAVTLLHFNDVYEITPTGGKGGLARVATLRDRLLAENPNTLTVLAGDLFSPSALGTAKVDGEPLAGRQMVAVLNEMGLDWATFGNHELDVSHEAFLARLAESRFRWVSGNVSDASGEPFPGVEPWTVLTFGAAGGPHLRLGLLGATLRSGDPDWVRIADPLETLAAQARELRPQVDVLVALTHLALEQDVELAQTVPEIDLVLGGHEHENWTVRRGGGLTPVLKADANVHTVDVVRLAFDPATRRLSIEPELVPIDDSLPADPETAAEADHWVEIGYAGFRASGFEPDALVAQVTEPLDGREASVRHHSTGLTDLIASSMRHAAPEAAGAVYNAGSIRIDDVLPPGPVTQYDVIRVLPFGGQVVEVEIAGGLLRQVLDQGAANQGTGGFLQYAGISQDGQGGWRVGGAPLAPERTYRIAFNDFLLSGREAGLGFLVPGPDLKVLGEHGDVRKALIAELERHYPK
jgi:5'-nucleotidase